MRPVGTNREAIPLGVRPALDGLRGLALLAVTIFHAAPPLFPGGWLGVDIFFTLSGFLITSQLLEEARQYNHIRLSNFYARRALRLLPALFVLLAVYLVMQRDLRVAAAVLFYVANWSLALGWPVELGPLQHTWSLSIEEQFYLVWPVCLIGLLRLQLKPRTLGLVIFGGSMLIAAHRAVLYLATSQVRVYHGLDTRSDGLLVGCALAALLVSDARSRQIMEAAIRHAAPLALLFMLGLLASTPYTASVMYLGGLFMVAISVACLILYVILHPDTPPTRVLELSPLVWVGRLSYGLYLWHWFIFETVKIPGARFTVSTMLKVALTFGVASASYYVVERPALRYKSRFASCSR